MANHVAALMLLRSTTLMETAGERDRLCPLPNCPCAPMVQMLVWWGASYTCVDITREQVNIISMTHIFTNIFGQTFKPVVL